MAGGGADPFEGVSATELRRRLIEAGDQRLDALSVEAAEARREQAVLAAELQRRGEPLEEPCAPSVLSSSTSASDRPKPSAAVQERLAAPPERVVAARPALRPTGMRPDRPEERDASSPGLSTSGPGTPS